MARARTMTAAVLSLTAIAAAASVWSPPDTHCVDAPTCNFAVDPATCDTLACKRPAITRDVARNASMTTNLTPAQRVAFEHGLAYALQGTDAVKWTTEAFATKVEAFVTGAAALLDEDVPAALREAFYANPGAHGGAPQGSVHNTGYVGPDVPTLTAALETGNIREVWGLMYVLSKTQWVSTTLARGLNERHWDNKTLNELGLNPEAVWTRAALVKKSNGSYNGVPNYLAPTFDSWVRFDFAGPDEAHPQWQPTRVSRLATAPYCEEVSTLTNATGIVPPLTVRETAYQCGAAPKPCKLRWYPGQLCYNVTQTPFLKGGAEALADPTVPKVPGFAARAAALDYRTVAGPSGTTANMLQLATMFGFGPSALALVRLTMVAWLIATDDHSFFEVLLGAEPYMADAFRMALGVDDLGRLMPEDVTVGNGDAATITFSRHRVWTAVVTDWLHGTDAGRDLYAALGAEQRVYVDSLLR